MEFVVLLGSVPTLLFFFAAVVGLFVGSFLNVVIHRLPIMMERRWQLECESAGESGASELEPQVFNLLLPHSRCPSCNTTIGLLENIPILSWLIQHGRCKHCNAPISLQYPIVEILTAILTVVVAMKFGASLQSLAAILFTFALIALSGIDFETTLLPDDITLPLMWFGLIINTFGMFTDIESAVLGAALGYMILWCVYHAFKILTGKEGMGYGDFKLLAALGAWLGWQQLPLIILLSSLLGAIVGIGLIVIRGRDKNIPIPFGPYLASAGWIALLWGDQLTRHYLKTVSS